MAVFAIEFLESKDILSVEDVRFSDAVSRMDITAPGDNDYVFAWNKSFLSGITIAGMPIYQLSPNIAPKMRSGATVSLSIRTPTGDLYTGNVGIDQFSTNEKSGKAHATMSGTFTGKRTQANEKPGNDAKHGMVVDMHNGTTYTMGFQDKRMDSAIRPFYIDAQEDNALTIPNAIKEVVKKIGGVDGDPNGFHHGHPADTSLKLLAATGKRFDRDSVAGYLQYGRGPRDCSPAAPSCTVGYEEERVRASFTPFEGNPNPICATLTVTKTIKVQVPTLSIRIPCVFDGPDAPAQPTFTGGVTDAAYTLFGQGYGSKGLRCDGIDYVAYEDQNGIYYNGTIRFVFKPGGWKSFAIACVYPTQLPLEGNQTQHSYANTVVYEQYYKYPITSFDPLSTICPNCYPEDEA